MSQAADGARPSDRGVEGGDRLEANAIGLGQSVIFAMAGSAPGQVIAISLAALVAAGAYGTILPLVITTATMLCIAVSYERLNLWRQNAGGPYEWVSRAVNPYVGFFAGWILLMAFLLGVLIDVISIGPAFLALVGADPDSRAASVISASVLGVLLTYLAVRGVKASARVQIGVALVEYVILLVLAVASFVAVFLVHKSGTVHPTVKWFGSSGVGGGALSASILVAVFMIAGWDESIYLSEETTAPEKTPGRAAIIAVALLGVFYIFMTLAFQGIARPDDLQAHSDNVVAFVGDRLAGTFGQRIAALAVLMSVIATTQAFIIGSSRIIYAMGRDRVLAPRLARVSGRFHTPVLATSLVGGLAVVFSALYSYSSSVTSALDDLIASIGLLTAIYYAVTALAMSWFYRRHILQSVRSFVIYAGLPIAGAGVLIWVAVQSAKTLPHGSVVSIVVIAALGVVALLAARLIHRAPIFSSARETAS